MTEDNSINIMAGAPVLKKIVCVDNDQEIFGVKTYSSDLYLASGLKFLEDKEDKDTVVSTLTNSVSEDSNITSLSASIQGNEGIITSSINVHVNKDGKCFATCTTPDALDNSKKIPTTEWIHNNAVTLATDQTITGVKTFTETIHGSSMDAFWADLAENYKADSKYPVGTLLQFGGKEEVTIATDDANTVVSEKPSYLMNTQMEDGMPCVMCGRVKVRVIGKVKKFDNLVLSNIPGIAEVKTNDSKKTSVKIKALESSCNQEEKLIECFVKADI